jgi:hypothetical protein
MAKTKRKTVFSEVVCGCWDFRRMRGFITAVCYCCRRTHATKLGRAVCVCVWPRGPLPLPPGAGGCFRCSKTIRRSKNHKYTPHECLCLAPWAKKQPSNTLSRSPRKTPRMGILCTLRGWPPRPTAFLAGSACRGSIKIQNPAAPKDGPRGPAAGCNDRPFCCLLLEARHRGKEVRRTGRGRRQLIQWHDHRRPCASARWPPLAFRSMAETNFMVAGDDSDV